MLALCLIAFLQIALESLPVSSSGHISLMEKIVQSLGGLKAILGLGCYGSLEQLLHLPSVVVLSVFILTHLRASFDNFKKRWLSLAVFVLLADLITVGLYFAVKKELAGLLPLWVGFAVTCGLILLAWLINRKSDNQLSSSKAVLLGLAQGIALAPGISRLAFTFFMGRIVGFSKNSSLLISLLMAVPLFIAGGIKGLFGVVNDLNCRNHVFSFCLLVSIVLASLLAFLLLVCLKWLIDSNKYWVLSIYMIVPIVISLFF